MLTRTVRILVLSAALAMTSVGCAAIVSALPAIIAAVTDSVQILDTIEAFVANYFGSHPDPAHQAKVADALAKCRIALNVALRVANGAQAADNAQVDKAFEDFKVAYLDLLGLVKPLGVHQVDKSGRISAAPGVLYVPEPLAFQKRH